MSTVIELQGSRKTCDQLEAPLAEAVRDLQRSLLRVMRGRLIMSKHQTTMSRVALTSFLMFGAVSAATLTGDLSKYRDFQLGSDLTTVAKQMGVDASQAKVIHLRPSLIQELQWRPQLLGSSSKTESAQEVDFSFYDGKLFRIAIDYDRYAIEGLTADDFIEAISVAYGIAEKPNAPANAMKGPYGNQEEILARWQDSQYCFDLMRSSYGPSFRLVGVLRRLQALAQTAIAEAKRLDDQEAPQRDAARMSDEKTAARAKLEKSRLVNKPNFRP